MRVVILTEAGKGVGYGHLTRCIAISQGLQYAGVETLLIVNASSDIGEILDDCKYILLDWLRLKSYLYRHISSEDIIVIDSYKAKQDIYIKLSKVCKKLVILDDNNRLNFPESILINNNVYASSLQYDKNQKITSYLGTRYVCIRKELLSSTPKKIRKKLTKIFVMFGGEDINHMIPLVLNLLQNNYSTLQINVVIGNRKQLRTINKQLITKKVKIFINPTVVRIRSLMLESDIAISSSGQSTYELLHLGLPTICIGVIDNQKYNALELERKHLVLLAGFWNDSDLDKKIIKCIKQLIPYRSRSKLYLKSKKYVDGKGVIRVVSIIKKLLNQ